MTKTDNFFELQGAKLTPRSEADSNKIFVTENLKVVPYINPQNMFSTWIPNKNVSYINPQQMFPILIPPKTFPILIPISFAILIQNIP